MKTTIKLITFAAVAALTGAAFAGDLEAVQSQNSHGQAVTIYRPVESTSIALFVAGRGTGARTAEATETTAAVKVNAHGQTAVQYERSSR